MIIEQYLNFDRIKTTICTVRYILIEQEQILPIQGVQFDTVVNPKEVQDRLIYLLYKIPQCLRLKLNKCYIYNMTKVIILSFDIPAGRTSLRVKIWRKLQKIGAEQELWSHWAIPFNQRNLIDMKMIAKDIINSGGNAKLIVGEEVI